MSNSQVSIFLALVQCHSHLLLAATRHFFSLICYGHLLRGLEETSGASIQARIGNLNDTVESLKNRHPQTSRPSSNRRIAKLKKFIVTLLKKWSKLADCVIGHVVWAPPTGVGVGLNRFTRDVCVVELYKRKSQHLIGNVLSLRATLELHISS
ncbi:hypothetical protein BDW22DRAFT_1429975 [Trametopsis cervina]|nr:hypothetical protein BDW22DRAFT_1429975 [Trametopsis cervina]